MRQHLVGAGTSLTQKIKDVMGCDECIAEYEDIKKSDRIAYVERNQEMINASDFCVFYYNPSYLPPKRKYSKRDISEYQPKSGTRLAWGYAAQKKHGGKDITIINFYQSE